MKINPANPTYSNFSRSFEQHWNFKENKKRKGNVQISLDKKEDSTNTAQTELSTSKHLWYA